MIHVLRNVAGRARRPGDEGTVTAELALALPTVLLVLVVLLVTVSAASARLRCEDAARTAARVAALGQSDEQVAAAAQHLAGPGASVVVVRDPPWVEVRVSAEVPGGWFSAGSLGLSSSASAWVEP